VLVSVIDVANNIFSDSLQRTCFKAMCALAFHLLLRVGEFTASPHNLQFSNVRCEHDQVEIIFPHYKHSHTQSRHTLVASPDILHCPVQLLAQYLAVRGQASGPLFVSAQGRAITRQEFLASLRLALVQAGYPAEQYNTHSFRIGGASHLAQQGVPEERIRFLGRWSSNANRQYIRIYQS
jgi:integrase